MFAFSWRDTLASHPLPQGQYAGDVVDQHEIGWCGWCYLVAAVQMVEDRLRISHSAATGRSPHGRISTRALIDTFREKDQDSSWSICQGGSSIHVLECMQDGNCTPRWILRNGEDGEDVMDVAVSVSGSGRLMEAHVRSELYKYGPVILEVNATTLKSASREDGKVTDLTYREPNHAVCVVGWEGDSWIVRNSWGTHGLVPKSIPSDYRGCSSPVRGENTCIATMETWHSMPSDSGFVLLPMSFAPLHDMDSPWIHAHVAHSTQFM